MSAWFRPEKVVVCTRLAGDHQSGVLLYVILRRYGYAKASLKGIAGTWSANSRSVWFRAAGMSEDQGDRALRKLDKRGLIEREHGAWGGNPNVLFVRPTERAQRVWHIATTFEALDAVLGDDKSSPLHKLWQAWPDDDPKPLGVIAEWYAELDDRKKTEYACGEPMDLKPGALDLLQQMVKIDPAIVMTDESLLLQRLWQGTHSVVKGLAV